MLILAILDCEDREVAQVSELSGLYRHIKDPDETRQSLYRFVVMYCITNDNGEGLQALETLKASLIKVGVLQR